MTLDAYHCHLKKVEDKEHFKIRQEFSRSLAKLNSLDTRDIVSQFKLNLVLNYMFKGMREL